MDQLDVIWGAAQCGFADWQDIWGDPWLSGTMMVLGYAAASFLLFRASRDLGGREKAVWRISAFLFAFQALNTPLDMHAFIWSFGKCLALEQGWYAAKQQAKLIFFITALSIMIAAICMLILLLHKAIWKNLMLSAGVSLSIGITALEAINLSGISRLIQTKAGPLFWADWLEMAGITIVCLAIWLMRQRLRTAPIR